MSIKITFPQVFEALSKGKHVRQARWDEGSELFVKDKVLLFVCRGGPAHTAQSDMLTWADMNRKDWRIIE